MSPAASVRPAGPGEHRTVAVLLAEFRDWWGRDTPGDDDLDAAVRRVMRGDDGEYLLAFDACGEPAGVCQLRYRWSVWTASPDCWLEDLFVAERARRGGLGRRLVEAALERARERGCRRIELDVNEQNEPALALYRDCGFSLEPKGPGRSLLAGRAP